MSHAAPNIGLEVIKHDLQAGYLALDRCLRDAFPILVFLYVQAIGARRLAVDEVERLLQHPEDLQRLASLREEYALKQQVFAWGSAPCGRQRTVQ